LKLPASVPGGGLQHRVERNTTEKAQVGVEHALLWQVQVTVEVLQGPACSTIKVGDCTAAAAVNDLRENCSLQALLVGQMQRGCCHM
jgi:hypothetical protein